VLTATAREQSRTGRTGVYDVEVRRSDGALVALFRGNAYETRGAVVPSFP
jgi:acyl-CoA thioesterase